MNETPKKLTKADVILEKLEKLEKKIALIESARAQKPQKMKESFYGIEGLEIIGHGEWSDPEVYEPSTGRRCNYYDVEDPMYSEFQSDLEYENPGITPEEIDRRTEEEFEDYVRNNEDLVWEYFNNVAEYPEEEEDEEDEEYEESVQPLKFKEVAKAPVEYRVHITHVAPELEEISSDFRGEADSYYNADGNPVTVADLEDATVFDSEEEAVDAIEGAIEYLVEEFGAPEGCIEYEVEYYDPSEYEESKKVPTQAEILKESIASISDEAYELYTKLCMKKGEEWVLENVMDTISDEEAESAIRELAINCGIEANGNLYEANEAKKNGSLNEAAGSRVKNAIKKFMKNDGDFLKYAKRYKKQDIFSPMLDKFVDESLEYKKYVVAEPNEGMCTFTFSGKTYDMDSIYDDWKSYVRAY